MSFNGFVKSIKNCHSEQPVPTRREGTSEESLLGSRRRFFFASLIRMTHMITFYDSIKKGIYILFDEFAKTIFDGLVKSTNHVILNEVRMKNLSQLSTRFFVASLPQNDSFGAFYETIIFKHRNTKFAKFILLKIKLLPLRSRRLCVNILTLYEIVLFNFGELSDLVVEQLQLNLLCVESAE